MSWINIKELNEKRAGILAQIKGLVADLTPENEAQIDSLQNEERKLAKQVELFKAAEESEKSVNELIGRDNLSGDKREVNVEVATRAWRKKNLFNQNLNDVEERALISAGSGFVPSTLAKEFINVRQTIRGPLAAGATEFVTLTAGPFSVPKMNDTSNTGELLATEITAFTADVAPTDSSVSLPAYSFSSKAIPVSFNFLRDSEIENVEAFIGQMAADRIYKAFNVYATTGTGSSQPQGCVYGSALGVTVASTSAVTYAEILDLLHSVDESYRAGAYLMFNDSTLKAVRKIVSSDGVPLWGPGNIVAGIPETLGGVPFVVNPNMANIGAGNKSILYGNFKAGYAVRRVGNVVVHNIGMTDKLAFNLVGALDLGGVVTDSTALKHLIHPAS